MKANLFLAAGPRCGSTQLAAWLGTNPDIGVSSIKEPNFFSSHEFSREYEARSRLSDVDPERYFKSRSKKRMQFAIFRERKHYDYLFENIREKWRLDGSTTYLHCPEAASSIREYNPDARVIILVRDPAKRALSHYKLMVRTGRTSRSLKEELEEEAKNIKPVESQFLLRQSRYKEAKQRFRDIFPSDQILELDFESVFAEPANALTLISKFLGVENAEFDLSVKEPNSSDRPRLAGLNLFLMNSGIKSQLRQVIPHKVREALRPYYFRSAHRDGDNESQQLELIRHYLLED